MIEKFRQMFDTMSILVRIDVDEIFHFVDTHITMIHKEKKEKKKIISIWNLNLSIR